MPYLAPFAAQHPHLRIELQLGDRHQDLVKDGVDVAIRLGRLPDSIATTRRIATIPRVIVASPGYRDLHGLPTTPAELTAHRIVGGPAAAVPTAWQFKRDDEEQIIKLEPHFSVNENEGAVAAAVAGLGITSTTYWACRRELDDAQLLHILDDWSLIGTPVHAFFPMGRDTRAVARAAIDHLAASFERDIAVP